MKFWNVMHVVHQSVARSSHGCYVCSVLSGWEDSANCRSWTPGPGFRPRDVRRADSFQQPREAFRHTPVFVPRHRDTTRGSIFGLPVVTFLACLCRKGTPYSCRISPVGRLKTSEHYAKPSCRSSSSTSHDDTLPPHVGTSWVADGI